MAESQVKDLRPRALAEVTSALMEADAEAMRGHPRKVVGIRPLDLAVILEWLDELREGKNG